MLVLLFYYAGWGEVRIWVLRHPLGALCNAATSALAARLMARREAQLRLQFASERRQGSEPRLLPAGKSKRS